MPSVDRLIEFTAILEAGSIAGGSRRLNLPRATLSRRLSALERELGVRLLHRRTRRLVLTPAGEELLGRARRIVADADAAWSAVRRLDDTPRGLLRVSVSSILDPSLFTDFLRDFPEVEIEVRASTRHVDLIADGVDVAIRFGEVTDADLIVRKVHQSRSVVVGSPAYLSDRPPPSHPDELADRECVVGFAGGWTPARRWPLRAGGTVPVGGRLAGNAVSLARAAALAGLGLALLPERMVRADIEEGLLVAVLEDVVGGDLPVSVVYADREFIDPKVRAFVDRAAQTLAEVFAG